LRFDKSSGELTSQIPISLPADVDVRSFALTKSDEYYVGGFYTDAAPPTLQYSSYSAIFRADGSLNKTVEGVTQQALGLDTLEHPFDNAVTVAEDGRIYIAQKGKVYILSQDGNIIRTLHVRRPPQAVISGMSKNGTTLNIDFWISQPQKPGHHILTKLDSNSGNVLGSYTPAPGVGIPVCMGDNFMFMRYPRGVVELVTAQP
jgi:hypothetical protein